MEQDFDYYGSNLPAQNGDAEGTPDWEDFEETVEQAAEVSKRCAIEREKFKALLRMASSSGLEV